MDEPHPNEGYCIVNTGTRRSGGSHWLAYADGIWYDSFGRSKYGDLSADAEQVENEYNCGQRSLVWLCVYHSLGAQAAKLI